MKNKLTEAFDKIEADSRLKESTKKYLNDHRKKRAGWFHRPAFTGTLAAVCMVFLVVLGIGGYSWVQTPVSYVSIDVNPSIELALNRFDRVVSATAFNPEGEEILKNLSLKGKKYSAAMEELVGSDAMGIYLTEDAELVLTVASQEQREQELQTEGEHCLQDVGCNSFSVSADVALVSDAHDNGFSLGKYYAYLQLARYDETVTPDSCRDMSISTIHELIDEHQHGRGHYSEPEDATEGSETGAEEELPGHHGHEDHH